MKHINSFSKRKNTLLCIVTTWACISQTYALAADSTKTTASSFGGELSIGVKHDNRLSVTDIDTLSNEDDHSALIDFGLNYNVALTTDTELMLTYKLSQSLHNEFDEFDIQSHFLSADLKHDFGLVNAGVAYRFINTQLDNDALLDIQQVSPYVSKLFGKKIYVRAAYTYMNKDFDGRNDRDADSHAYNTDVYYFLDKTNTYVIVGYKFKDEDANDSQFDYDSHNFKVRFIKKIQLGSYKTKLKAGWRLESRDYSSVTNSIGKKRDDNRRQYKVEWEVSFSEKMSGTLEYKHSVFSSNLPVADYSHDVISASVAYKF